MADGALRILEYLDASGQSPFARWFGRLNPTAAAKVTIALYRLEHGNFSNVKGVSAGVGDRIIILLGGSDKKGQAVAILNSQAAWTLYKKRKTKPGTN
jgi:putative component of toxin-antitoxin plasmid stabilization module